MEEQKKDLEKKSLLLETKLKESEARTNELYNDIDSVY